MKFYTIPHTCYGGIDRHVDGMYCGVLDAEGAVRVPKNRRTNPQAFLQTLTPCRAEVVVGVEGLVTWSWLAALGEDDGMPVVLGPALYMRAMHGGNAQHDRIDAHPSAARLRGGLMPHADVDPRRMRATRDRWRRRNHLMHQRAELEAHRPKTSSQYHLGDPLGRIAKPQNRRGLRERFAHRGVPKTMAVALALVDGDEPRRAELARDIEKTAQGHEPVSRARLRTVPGVGNILALVLRYELEESARVPRVQAVVADCRPVTSARESKGKRHGPRGKKSGTAPLQWAFAEAAVLVRKNKAPAQQDLATRATRPGQGTARSILAHKRGRAVYCRLKHPVAVDQAKFLAP